MKTLLLGLLLLLNTSAFATPSCDSKMSDLVNSIISLDFNGKIPAGFKPYIISMVNGPSGALNYIYTIDMRNDQGVILNGSAGGSSAYQVNMNLVVDPFGKSNICFVNSVTFVDEP